MSTDHAHRLKRDAGLQFPCHRPWRQMERRGSRLRRLRAGRPLVDEIEKAHPDILNILLQVMDHATLTDNNGRKAEFRQVVLIMFVAPGSS